MIIYNCKVYSTRDTIFIATAATMTLESKKLPDSEKNSSPAAESNILKGDVLSFDIDHVAEQKLIRKLDAMIVPPVCKIYSVVRQI